MSEGTYSVSVLTPDGWKTFINLQPTGFFFRRGEFSVVQDEIIIKPFDGGLIRASTFFIERQ